MGWMAIITVLLFLTATKLYRHKPIVLFVPVFFAVSGSVILLKLLDISFDRYFDDNRILTFFLGPCVVALGVLLYKQIQSVKRDISFLLISIAGGSAISVLSVLILALVFKLPDDLTASMVPLSITTPVAIEVSDVLSGDPGITSVLVIAVGIFGNMYAPKILGILGIKDNGALGVGIGTGSHGIGTARAIAIDERAGLYSGLAMAINAVITVFLAPAVWSFFH